MLALWFAMSALGIVRPGWMVIFAAILAAIAGTVGRAQDARRWNRLQRGSTSPAYNSLMWSATPWYLLRSMLSVGFAFLLSLGVVAVITVTSYSSGIIENDSSILGSFPPLTRFILLFLVEVAIYLLILWLVPWGAATRRGGAHIVNMLAPGDRSRRRMMLVLLTVGVIVLILTLAGAMPNPNMSPFAGS